MWEIKSDNLLKGDENVATEIKVWQIINDKLEVVETTMAEVGQKKKTLKWIKNNPIILGEDILIIGEQVPTKSGLIDFLGIDKSRNLVVVELKRDLSKNIDKLSL